MKILKKLGKKQFLGLGLLFILTFAMGAFITGALNGFYHVNLSQQIKKGEKINILFMGIDAREGEFKARSDTMFLASIDFHELKAALIWIPRDTRVQNTRGNNVKINSFNFTQGPEEACNQVGKLLNTKVDHFVVIDFQGFEKIIDTLGGVHMDVERNMYHPDPDPNLRINLSQGYQLLNGKQALDYVRYRGGPTADIGRTQRQQQFIKAFAAQIMKPQTVLKLPQLIPEWKKSVYTNIDLNHTLHMANLGRSFQLENIITQTLPGYSYTDPISGASYWEVDRALASGIIENLLAGETYEVAQDPPTAIRSRNTQSSQPVERENQPNNEGDNLIPDVVTQNNQTENDSATETISPGIGETDAEFEPFPEKEIPEDIKEPARTENQEGETDNREL